MAASYSIPPRVNFVFGALIGIAGALVWRAPWRAEASLAEWLVPVALAIGFAYGVRAAGFLGIVLAALGALTLWGNAQIADVDSPQLRQGTLGAILLCMSAATLFGAAAVVRSRSASDAPVRQEPT